MLYPSNPSFEHKASLEELVGFGKDRHFDEVIDDDDSEAIHVILSSERRLYEQEAKRFDWRYVDC